MVAGGNASRVKVEMNLSSNPRLTPSHKTQLDEYNNRLGGILVARDGPGVNIGMHPRIRSQPNGRHSSDCGPQSSS